MTDELRDKITAFLMRNFPQIQMHGGEHTIKELDEDKGAATINLSGACGSCGISYMTVQAIQRRMVEEVDGIDNVTVEIGGGFQF